MNFKFLPLLLLGTATHAALVKPLDSLKVIEVSISREGLTRIAVQEDRILNVFGVTGEYVLEADEDQGQIFIQPALGVTTPLSLTITTEGGHTQDLRFVPKNQPPEALILAQKEENLGRKHLLSESSKSLNHSSFPSSPLQLSSSQISRSPINRPEIEDLLQACKEEKIPLGYKLIPIDWQKSVSHSSQWESAKNLPFSPLLIRELKGERLRGLTYDLKNSTDTPLTLSESAFVKSLNLKRSSIIAVLIPKKSLIPGERISIYVIAKSLE
jgi:hypothetical protein